MDLMNEYKKIILKVKEKTNNEQDKIYSLEEEELFEYLWSVILIKRSTDTLYNYISKPMIRNLIAKIKSNEPPRDLGAYIKGMAISQKKREEEYSERIKKKNKKYWWMD